MPGAFGLTRFLQSTPILAFPHCVPLSQYCSLYTLSSVPCRCGLVIQAQFYNAATGEIARYEMLSSTSADSKYFSLIRSL